MQRKKKVLIVDDEVLVRIGIRHSVPWEENELEVVGEASDGKQCMEMVERMNPDLLILDINMPELNGIEVLKQLKQREYDGKIIILTCYEELEYARQAMKYGASDYVLKTSITENGLLQAIQELVFEERTPNGASLERTGGAEQELVKILQGYSKQYDLLPLSANYLYCISCTVLHIDQVLERYETKGSALFYTSLHSIFRQVLGRIKEQVMINYQSDEIVIFVSFRENPGEQECMLLIRELTKQLSNVLQEYLQVEAIIGISSVKYSLSKIKEAYEEAGQAKRNKFIDSDRAVFYFHAAPQNKEEQETIKEYEHTIREQLSDHKYEQLQETLFDYVQFMRKSGTSDVCAVRKFLGDIGKIMQSNEKMWEENYEEKVGNTTTLEEAESILYGMLNQVCDSKEDEEADFTHNYLIRRADEYILNNYKNNISLSSLAAHLQLSESYTSRLFNKHKGVNLPAYINDLRIQGAKELLLTTNQKIYEIAEEVGFASVTALHIAFRKSQGMSPAEYRNHTKDKK